jgi:hypothetical protein
MRNSLCIEISNLKTYSLLKITKLRLETLDLQKQKSVLKNPPSSSDKFQITVQVQILIQS